MVNVEVSGPFESSGDGLEEADWLELEDIIFPTSGYVAGYANELLVSPHAPTPGYPMSVDVATGAAVVKSTRYRNKAVAVVPIDDADATQDRIDLIVVQRTLNAPNSTCIITVHKGTNYTAGNAVAPTRTQSATVEEIVLATVLITHGITAIVGTGTSLITDKRLSADCGAYAPKNGFFTSDPATGYPNTNGKYIVMGTGKITGMGDATAAKDGVNKDVMDAAIVAAVGAIDTLPDPTGKGGYEVIANSGGTAYELALRHYFVTASASDTLKTSSDAEVNSTTAMSWQPLKVLAIPPNHNKGGVYRIKWDVKSSAAIGVSSALFLGSLEELLKLTYKDTSSTDYTTHSVDVTVPTGGGLLILCGYGNTGGATAQAYIRNFRIYCTETITQPGW